MRRPAAVRLFLAELGPADQLISPCGAGLCSTRKTLRCGFVLPAGRAFSNPVRTVALRERTDPRLGMNCPPKSPRASFKQMLAFRRAWAHRSRATENLRQEHARAMIGFRKPDVSSSQKHRPAGSVARNVSTAATRPAATPWCP